MKQQILVTGSAGFIGKVVVQKLLEAGYSVIAMCRPETIAPFQPHPNLRILWGDITQYEAWSKQVHDVSAIIHLAANKYHPTKSYEVNLQGARNLVRLLDEGRVKGKRLINISSQSTKIKWRGVYGESKRQSDEILEKSHYRWTTLKPSLVYGSERGTLFQTIKNYIEKLPVVPMIGNGRWELYPIDVDDLASFIIQCLKKEISIGKVYDLGTRQKVTFDQLVQLISQELKITKPILHIPTWIGLPAVYLATKLIPGLPITVDNVLGSTQQTHCEPRPAIRELKVVPITTKAGIKKYLGHQKDQRLAVAVVGLGKMGIMHASLLSTFSEVRVAAIIDQDQGLGQTARSMGINAQFYPSIEEALAQEKLDLVYICTPTFAHAPIMEVCEKNDLPYFVEKPVFPRYQEYARLSPNPNNMAGYFWIYKREVAYTQQLLKNKVIGQIKSYKVKLLHSEVFGPKKGWLFKKELSGGGVLANPGPHAISLIHYLFGTPKVNEAKVEYLYGNEVEDVARLSFRHPGGIGGELTANWSVPNHPMMTIEYEIMGSQGYIKYVNGKLQIKQKNTSKVKVIDYQQIPYGLNVFDLNPQGGGEAYYSETHAFIKAMATGKKTYVNDLSFAKRVEKTIEEAYDKS